MALKNKQIRSYISLRANVGHALMITTMLYKFNNVHKFIDSKPDPNNAILQLSTFKENFKCIPLLKHLHLTPFLISDKLLRLAVSV